LRLDGQHVFDENSFEKILKTIVAIANLRRNLTGYVLVGVTDKASDAARVAELYLIIPSAFERFWVTGVEHEALALGIDLDQLFRQLTERIRNSGISEPLRDYVARNVKLVRYFDKSVVIFETRAQDDPSNLSGHYYVRHGSEVIEIPPTEYGELFRRYQRGH
jgi:predicted HTH transcriptional regulator